MSVAVIRLYRPGDREAVRRICCDTACYGAPIERVFSDRELMADGLMDYYTEFEPESLHVAELGDRVVGYCAGCLETRRFLRVCARRIAPRLLWLFVSHGHLWRGQSWRLAFAMMASGRKPARDRGAIIAEYPAHCHVNIQPGLQRAGVGSALLGAWFAMMKRHRVTGIHVSTATEEGKRFFGKAGLRMIARYPTPRLPIETPSELWVMAKRLE